MQWLDETIVLQGKKVKLIPFEMAHYDAMLHLSKNSRIWEYYPEDGGDENYLRFFFETALKFKEQGTHYPFTVIDNNNGNIIGTTRFGEISPENKRVEIGWTWYDPHYWGKGYNEDCKWVLLQYAFEVLGVIRVEINAWEANHRSRRAIVRIGATFEGVLRDRIISSFTGKVRGTAFHSILSNEWPAVRSSLMTQRDERYAKQ